MKRLTTLKLKLLEKGVTQRSVAKAAGINEGLLSLISNGRYLPDAVQRKKIASVVNVPERELFQELRH